MCVVQKARPSFPSSRAATLGQRRHLPNSILESSTKSSPLDRIGHTPCYPWGRKRRGAWNKCQVMT